MPRALSANWLETLSKATLDAQEAVAAVAAAGERGVVVGTGAAGDKTLLADRKAEDALAEVLVARQGLRMLSEEAGQVGDPRSSLTAVVDPLDGSSNFQRGLPFYCSSVAIAGGSGLESVTAGAVRNLVSGDLYYAERGLGATKNGAPIRTTRAARLEESVVGVDLSGSPAGTVAGHLRLLSGSKRVVHYGANALELCLLADGSIDSFVDLRGRMRVTDIAAGCLIAQEAGAAVRIERVPESAPELSFESRFNVVASATAALQGEVLASLKSGRGA